MVNDPSVSARLALAFTLGNSRSVNSTHAACAALRPLAANVHDCGLCGMCNLNLKFRIKVEIKNRRVSAERAVHCLILAYQPVKIAGTFLTVSELKKIAH
jgi:hypothetical protein